MAASPRLSDDDEVKVAALVDMGFDAEQVREVLRMNGGDQARAMEVLLSGG